MNEQNESIRDAASRTLGALFLLDANNVTVRSFAHSVNHPAPVLDVDRMPACAIEVARTRLPGGAGAGATVCECQVNGCIVRWLERDHVAEGAPR